MSQQANQKKLGTAWITGASTGIGATYADRLAKRGYDLVLVARNKQRLEDVASKLREETGVSIETLSADLSSATDLAKVSEQLRRDRSVTMLVNNAGSSVGSVFVGADVEAIDAMIRLNVLAVTHLAAAVLPHFVAQRNGTLINIASVLALAPELLSGTYSGTKAYVLNLSQSLQNEVGHSGVRVQAVLPGATHTEIWAKSGKDISSLPAGWLMGVDEMVDAALAGLDMGELVTIPSLPNIADWDAFVTARQLLGPNLSRDHAAARYRHKQPEAAIREIAEQT
jgi:short-subunit dehydrogenase